MQTPIPLSRDLATAVDLEAILQMIIEHIYGETFAGKWSFCCQPKTPGRRASQPGFLLDTNEQAVAIWAYQNGQPAGRGTETLPAARVRL